MAVKKATVDSTMAKVEAAAKAAEKKEAPAKKAPAKKATTTKAATTKTAEKKEAFDLICAIVSDIKETVSYLSNADSYTDKTVGGIEFSRLYSFLDDIHNNRIEDYLG